MKATRWQFSLRQLILAMTVVAIVVMLVSHQWRLVVGLLALAAALLEVFYPVIETLAVFLDPRNWRSLPERKPTKGEIKKLAETFTARYPKGPRTAANSDERPDSK